MVRRDAKSLADLRVGAMVLVWLVREARDRQLRLASQRAVGGGARVRGRVRAPDSVIEHYVEPVVVSLAYYCF